MSSLALLLLAATFAGAFLLWDRVRGEELAPLVGERIWDVGADGARGLDVMHREAHDPYRTVGELLERLPDVAAADRRLKLLYQLQGTLGFDVALLRPDVDAVVGTTVLDRTVARVEMIAPGALVDRATMHPLGSGSSVRQPLGVVAYDENGRVLAKAKVVTR